MLPADFETARPILSPMARADAPAIFNRYAQDPEVTRFLTFRPHQSISDTTAYIARCETAPADETRTYVLIGRLSARLLGAIELRRPEPHRLGFGYCWRVPIGGRV